MHVCRRYIIRRRKKARQERGWRESKRGRRGSRRGVERRSERPRTSDIPGRRRDRGRGKSGKTEAGLREARAGGRSWVRRKCGAAHPRAASLPASAFTWAKRSSELLWAGVREMMIVLSRFTWSRRTLMRAIMCLFATGLIALVANSLKQ